AVISAELPASTLAPGSTARLSARIRPVDRNRPSLIELYLDEKRIRQELHPPDGRDVADVMIKFPVGDSGQHTLRLHIADADRLSADQDFHITYTVGNSERALVLDSVNGSQGRPTSFFINAAVTPQSADETLSLTGMSFTTERA